MRKNEGKGEGDGPGWGGRGREGDVWLFPNPSDISRGTGVPPPGFTAWPPARSLRRLGGCGGGRSPARSRAVKRANPASGGKKRTNKIKKREKTQERERDKESEREKCKNGKRN